jgi:hypothetical protein
MRGFVLLCCAVVTPLRAQDAPAPKGGVLVDAIVATVNDGAITLSELRTLAAGRIRSAEAKGPLSGAARESIAQQALGELIDKHRLAQAAKSFGVFTPEQIEMFFQRELAHQQQEQLRDFGSFPAITAELKRQGKTWGTVQGEKRVDIMSRFAKEFAVYMRLQKQSNLYLTPRMLRETYERDRHLFVHGAAALVSIVVFRGNDARASAEKAAAEWREQEIDGQQLAAHYPGAIALSDKTADSLAPELDAIKTFALAGPIGNISPPFESDGAVRIAKITAFVAEENGRFEDPEVQDKLRNRCEQSVFDEFLAQALERAAFRTEVWESDYVSGGRPKQKN